MTNAKVAQTQRRTHTQSSESLWRQRKTSSKPSAARWMGKHPRWNVYPGKNNDLKFRAPIAYPVHFLYESSPSIESGKKIERANDFFAISVDDPPGLQNSQCSPSVLNWHFRHTPEDGSQLPDSLSIQFPEQLHLMHEPPGISGLPKKLSAQTSHRAPTRKFQIYNETFLYGNSWFFVNYLRNPRRTRRKARWWSYPIKNNFDLTVFWQGRRHIGKKIQTMPPWTYW